MKTKKIETKLTLNKETVADLGKEELASVKGGKGGTFMLGCIFTKIVTRCD
ncbi:MAG: hypothetical protein GY950_05770 [bacterium]|nr:hypothetical protein [bacterium]